MKNSVKLAYASGFKLMFPKISNAPMLFLEWVEIFNQKHNSPLCFKVSQQTDQSEILNDLFVIRLETTKENAIDCLDYIKNNM